MKNLPFLSPASFTIVMGTGALSLATLDLSQNWPPLHMMAQFLNILNYAIFFLLTLWAFFCWPRNMPLLRENFKQPDNCALYSAVGIALLVLGTQALRFKLGPVLACVIWGSGALLTFTFNYGILMRFFLHPGIEMAHITPVLFVPAASMVVLPVGGAPIGLMLGGITKNIIFLACIIALGGGLALYMGLFGIMLQRHLLLRPLPDQLAPTLWIHLAPIGWAGVAIISMRDLVFPQPYWPAIQFIALLLFGAALWWLIMAALLCLRAMIKHTLDFSLTWWSFIFPIGSVTILSEKLDFPPANMLFPGLWLLLAALWCFCAIKTVIFIKKR